MTYAAFERGLKTLVIASLLFACEARATPDGKRAHARDAADAAGPAIDRARAALVRGDATLALRLAADGLRVEARRSVRRGEDRGDMAARLHFLAARAAVVAHDEDAALEHLEAAAREARSSTTARPLTRWIALERATLLETRDAAKAVELARGLVEAWPGCDRARRIEARALLRLGRVDEALPKLRALVRESHGSTALANVALPLADRLAENRDPASLEEALALYRLVATRSSRTRDHHEAQAKAESVLARLPEERRTALAELSIDDRLARADALSSAMRNDEAVEAYDAVLARLEANDPRTCAVLHGRARAIERGRDRARTARIAAELAERCSAPDVLAWALYKGGRAEYALGHTDAALALFERLEREAPTHRLADDASYFAAVAERDAGRIDAMKARLARFADAYPEGDMRSDALFVLAWQARHDAKYGEALAALERSIAVAPVEESEDSLGRALYWKARTLADLERVDEARNAYVAVAEAFPLGFYGQLAIARLREADDARVAALLTALRGTIEPVRSTSTTARASDFERAGSLLSIGLVDEAMLELSAIPATNDHASDEAVFLAASLLSSNGFEGEAARLVRRRYVAFRRAAPTGAMGGRWRVAYPLAFSPLIEESAARESIPAAFVRAIAREESTFEPTAVSRAQAYGLIQILLSTARAQSRHVGFSPTTESLRDPETNLRFGTSFMRTLFERYEKNPGLVPAAYNAGSGAVERWLREDRTRPFDVFVEEIPYEETRRYTRRVLQSYGIYAFLDGGELPMLPSTLPD